MSEVLSDESKNRYSGHIPNAECVEEMRAVRKAIRALAFEIERLCPNTRERATAMTHLEMVMMFANASIVRCFPIDPAET